MNQLEFIQKINKIVKENGYKDVISILEDPPGRRPDEKLKKCLNSIVQKRIKRL